jgi:hypothetical protein
MTPPSGRAENNCGEGDAIQLRDRYLSRSKERGEEEWPFFALSSFPCLAGMGALALGKDGVVARGFPGAEVSDFLEGGRRGVDSEDALGRPYLLCSVDSAAA